MVGSDHETQQTKARAELGNATHGDRRRLKAAFDKYMRDENVGVNERKHTEVEYGKDSDQVELASTSFGDNLYEAKEDPLGMSL